MKQGFFSLIIFIISFLFLFPTISYAENYYREIDDNGRNHYYLQDDNGNIIEISENEYYNNKFDNNTDVQKNQEEDYGHDITYNSYDNSNESLSQIFENRKTTIVNSEADVTRDNFEDITIYTDDYTNEKKYFVLLSDNYVAEINPDLFYLFLYKYKRNTMSIEDVNKKVNEITSDVGHVNIKAFLDDEIKGYPIYLKISQYFGNNSFSFFVYGPEYTANIDLPEGEYFFTNGGILNDYNYKYPIKGQSFVVRKGETISLGVTIGSNVKIPDDFEITAQEPSLNDLGNTVNKNNKNDGFHEEETVSENKTNNIKETSLEENKTVDDYHDTNSIADENNISEDKEDSSSDTNIFNIIIKVLEILIVLILGFLAYKKINE